MRFNGDFFTEKQRGFLFFFFAKPPQPQELIEPQNKAYHNNVRSNASYNQMQKEKKKLTQPNHLHNSHSSRRYAATFLCNFFVAQQLLKPFL